MQSPLRQPRAAIQPGTDRGATTSVDIYLAPSQELIAAKLLVDDLTWLRFSRQKVSGE